MKRMKWFLALAIAGIAVWQLTLLAGAAPGVPGRPDRTPRPDLPGREAGPPASITLSPDRLEIVCDGAASTRLTVRIEDAAGRPIADGTYVFFDVRYGFTDPVEAVTRNGEASTNVFLYPYAANFPGQTDVFVFVHPLRASIGIGCARSDTGGCGPTTSPACTPTATPTPCRGNPSQCGLTPTPGTACGPFLSPPCPTPQPCDGSESPPCPLPCGPNFPSPPCQTPNPTSTAELPCGPEFPSPPCQPTERRDCRDFQPATVPAPNPLYRLTVATEATAAGVDVTLGVDDLGGGPYLGVQWHLCFDPDVVDPIAVARADGASPFCSASNINESVQRVLTGCIDVSGAVVDYFGAAFTAGFTCISNGPARFWLLFGADTVAGSAVFDEDITEQAMLPTESTFNCQSSATTHTVSGVVCETSGGGCGALRGATVALEPGGYSATTSITDGSFAINGVPDGDYTLLVDPGCTPFGCYDPLPLTVDGGDVIVEVTPRPVGVCVDFEGICDPVE